MMRIVPKRTKLKATVWLNLTIWDVLLGLAEVLLAFLIVLSNLSIKWMLLAFILPFGVMLFFPAEEGRIYSVLLHMLLYFVSRKTYVAGQKRGDAADLIPFKEIDDDGVIVYDGYLGAVLSVGSIKFGLLDEFEQNMKISSFARALNNLGENTVMQLVKIDRPINYDEVAAGIFAKLEQARNEKPVDKAKIVVLESRLAQIDGLNNLEKQYRPYYYIVVYENDKDSLYKQVDVMRSCLSAAGLDVDMLMPEEVAVFFKYCYTRDFDEREIEGVAREDYPAYVKPKEVRFKNTSYISDGITTFTWAISDYPLWVGNAWGANIFNIDNTKVVLTIRPVEKGQAVRRIDRAVVELGARRQSGKISEAVSKETHIQTMANLAQSLQNENELLFDCMMTVTAFNNTKEKNSAFRKDIRRKITADGFKVSFLRGRQFGGFAAATVARRNAIKTHERGINSESLAAVFPFVFTSMIEPDGFTLGYDYYPVVLDIWKRDAQQYINSNIMVIGKSGSGKSFFTKTLLSLVYSENSQIFILDPENEYNTLCKNVGGRFIDVGNATEGRINPLHVYQILTDDGVTAEPEVVFAAHLQFLESFFKITLTGIKSDALEELNNILAKVYESRGIKESTDCSKLKAEDFPTFDDLLKTVEKEIAGEKLVSRLANLENVKTYVAKFASGGRFSTLWNGPSTLTSQERMVVFNFQSLLGAKNKIVANAQMLVIMRYLDQQIINIREKNRSGRYNIHPFVVLDEGYNFIDPEYPVGLDFVYMWYKRIRKYNGSIMFLTQNLSDILGNTTVVQKTTAIINNAQYSFIFALAPADLEILADLYKNAGAINETERSQIANAGNGECFAICSAKTRTSFKVEAANVVYTLFDVQDAMAKIEAGDISSPQRRA